MRVVGLIALLSCLLATVRCYPSGAGIGACVNFNPSGHGSPPPPSQAFPSPYTITANSATYTAGQQIQVTLAGVCDRKFKGFLIQARAADPTAADAARQGNGTFVNLDDQAKPWCEPGNFAATHTNSNEKSSVVVTWTAPSTTVGHIVFVVTFVESTGSFWEKQRSSIIRDTSDSSNSSYQGVPSAVLSSSDCNTGSGLQKPDGCGTTIGCFTDCTDSGCNNIVTWTPLANSVQFSIKGRFPAGVTNGYMALGLSDDQKMGSDGVTECVYLNGQMSVHNSQNNGRSNLRMASTLATLTSGSYTDGIFECSFELPSSDANAMLDIQKDRYILLARGTSVTATNLLKHSQNPMVSSAKADFQKTALLVGSETSDLFIKVHGSLMVVAWIFAASLGIVIARYFKPQWPESKCLGEKVWFQMHRGFMILAFLAAVIAFILIFVHVQGYSDLGQEASKKAHPILGIIVTALAVINPIMALFRPHPGDANRPIFNWAHFGVGSAAHVLGVVTVFLGVNLGRPAVPSYVTWILVGYVAWQILIEFLLVFVRCKTEAKERSESYELAQKGLHPTRQQDTPSPQSSPVRQGLLLLHIVAITALSTAVIVCIVIA